MRQLVMRSQRQVIGNGVLRWCMHREDNELMGLAKFAHQGNWREAIRDLPAGDMVSFAERRNHKRALGQRGKACDALMQRAVEHHVLVDFVADEHNIGVTQYVRERFHIFPGPAGCSRVVRRVDHDGAGSRRHQ